MAQIGRRLKSNRGAALVEYALIIAGVALIGAAAVSVFGKQVTSMLTTAAATLPGSYATSDSRTVSGVETFQNVTGLNEGNPATGQSIGNNVGVDGSLSSLVVETKNR